MLFLFESANVHDILFVRTSVEWVFSMPPVRDGYSSFRGGKKRSVRLNRCPNKRERFLGNVYNIHEILIFVEFLVLLNLYSTIIFAEKKLWIVQDVEA